MYFQKKMVRCCIWAELLKHIECFSRKYKKYITYAKYFFYLPAFVYVSDQLNLLLFHVLLK